MFIATNGVDVVSITTKKVYCAGRSFVPSIPSVASSEHESAIAVPLSTVTGGI